MMLLKLFVLQLVLMMVYGAVENGTTLRDYLNSENSGNTERETEAEKNARLLQWLHAQRTGQASKTAARDGKDADVGKWLRSSLSASQPDANRNPIRQKPSAVRFAPASETIPNASVRASARESSTRLVRSSNQKPSERPATNPLSLMEDPRIPNWLVLYKDQTTYGRSRS